MVSDVNHARYVYDDILVGDVTHESYVYDITVVSDVTHASMPAFDHTYGPSSSSGHFLHVGGSDTQDVLHDGDSKATLTSQHFDVTDTRLCVHYWYAIATERTGKC